MSTLEVSASATRMEMRVDGTVIAVKHGRGPWVNVEGHKLDARRFPRKAREYIALAKSEYRRATST